ncbi:Uncharacterized protein Rs2_42206 [Raphanus sativus]|nr:Uncharacterized protein Rs2_42206 [Raphanus sativus]
MDNPEKDHTGILSSDQPFHTRKRRTTNDENDNLLNRSHKDIRISGLVLEDVTNIPRLNGQSSIDNQKKDDTRILSSSQQMNTRKRGPDRDENDNLLNRNRKTNRRERVVFEDVTNIPRVNDNEPRVDIHPTIQNRRRRDEEFRNI